MIEIRFKNGLMQINHGDFAGWTNVVDTELLAELSGALQTAVKAQAEDLTKKVDFWQAIAARRKERCNYLAEEMRKYRDMPVEQRIDGVRAALSDAGVRTVSELVNERDAERNARLAGVGTMNALRDELARVRRELDRVNTGAELTELRAVNDKLQASIDSTVAVVVELTERAEAAEADARIKGENLKVAKYLLVHAQQWIACRIPDGTTMRVPGHVWNQIGNFPRGSK